MATITLTVLILAALLAAQQRFTASLSKQQDWLNVALEAGRMGAWEWDIRSGRVIWSTQLEVIHGLAPGTFGGRLEDFQQDIHPDDRALVFQTIERTLRELTDYHVEYRIIQPNNQVAWLSAHARLILNAQGEPEKMVGVCADITQRKRSDQDAMRLAAIVEFSDDSIISASLNGIMTSWNAGAERIFGYTAEETIGQSIMILIPPELHHEELVILKRLKRGEQVEHYETKRIKKNGQVMDVSLTISPIKDKNQRIIGISKIAREITAQKQAERALRASEQRFRQLTETVPSFVWTAAPDGSITFSSEQWYVFSGITKEQTATGWLSILHPDDRQRCSQEWQNAIERGEPYQIEVRNRRADGQYRWLLSRAIPVRNEQGQVMEWLGVSTDITEQKESEQRTKASLHEKELLLKEIHHRVKNNLQIIASLLNLHLSSLKDSETALALKESQNRLQAMALVHEKLYSSDSFSSIDMQQYVTDLAQQLLYSLAKSDAIRFEVQVDDIRLGIDMAIPCGLMLHELLSNAIKHAFPTGQGIISVIFRRILQEEDAFELIVKDNGIGMPKHVVFPHGVSLGLQLIRMLADQIQGTVELKRSPGTTFLIRFSSRLTQKQKEESRLAPPRQQAGHSILIVEDEQIIAMDLRSRLKRLGYTVCAVVSSGKAAVERTRELRPEIVLMDIGLSGELDGIEAAHQIREAFSIPIVFITAHADGPSRARANTLKPAGYILKPFNETELQRVINAALAATKPSEEPQLLPTA